MQDYAKYWVMYHSGWCYHWICS